MNTSSLFLDEIYALAHEALIGAGASEEHANAVADVVTRAERDGSEWRLSGHKTFVIDGHVADQLVVSARVSGEAGDRDRVSMRDDEALRRYAGRCVGELRRARGASGCVPDIAATVPHPAAAALVTPPPPPPPPCHAPCPS